MVKSVRGFSGNVLLSCENLPHGLWCDFSPKELMIPFDGAAETVLQLRPDDVPGGSYRFRVVAQAGDVRGSYSFPFKISAPSSGTFVVACDSDEVRVPLGATRSFGCRVESHHGLDSPVSLSCRSPDGLSCSISPSTVTPTPYGTPSSVTLSVTVPANQRMGQYTLFIDGKNSEWSYPGAAKLVQVFTIQPSFTLACDSSTLTAQGESASTICRVNSVDGFNQEVRFSCALLPSPMECSFDPSSARVPEGGSASSILTVKTNGMGPGTYEFFVDAAGPWRSEGFGIKLVIPEG